MAVGDAYVFPGFLTPVLTQIFFPKPPTTFLTIKTRTTTDYDYICHYIEIRAHDQWFIAHELRLINPFPHNEPFDAPGKQAF